MFHLALDAIAEWRADHPAVRFGDDEITYAELIERGQATARWLVEHGVSDTDRVAWLGLNDPFLFDLLYGASLLGAVVVPLNSRLSAAEHRVRLDRGMISLALCQPGFAETLEAALPTTCRMSIVDDPVDGGPIADLGSPNESSPLLLVFTSGTTGSPKGALHTQATLAATFENGRIASDLTADDVTLGFLPMFHVGGLNIQVLPTLLAGGTVVLHEGFDPTEVLADIERWSVTTSVFVPATIQAVAEHPKWSSTDLTSLRGVMTGSSVIPDHLLQVFADRGVPPGQVYGSTETGPTVVVLSFADALGHIGAAGTAAASSEARIVDGELQVRGANLFVEYVDNAAATTAAFDDGWYRTGDAAHVDDAGMIRIDGRLDDLFISGGENIDPAEVEAALAAAPGVAEIAIVGVDDARWGQVPVAFVVVDGTGMSPTLDDLRAFGEVTLARFKLPTALHLVSELPRTSLGKVQRFLLRDDPGSD